jgi:hypothetical protein
MPELLDQIGPGDAEDVGHGLHREPSRGGDGKRNACFFLACLLQGLAEDLGFDFLAAEEAFELADAVLEVADAADGNDLLVCPDRLVPALGHAAPPLEQQARGDTGEPGDGGDRHAGLRGLLDQPDLLLGSVASAALDAGNDSDALDGLRHRRMP